MFFFLAHNSLATEEITGLSLPDGFGWAGRIDQELKEMVIGDSLYVLSDSTKFFTATGKLCATNSFHDGMAVHYLLDDDHSTVLALWQATENELAEYQPGFDTGNERLPSQDEAQDKTFSPDRSSLPGSGLKYNNGVWTN